MSEHLLESALNGHVNVCHRGANLEIPLSTHSHLEVHSLADDVVVRPYLASHLPLIQLSLPPGSDTGPFAISGFPSSTARKTPGDLNTLFVSMADLLCHMKSVFSTVGHLAPPPSAPKKRRGRDVQPGAEEEDDNDNDETHRAEMQSAREMYEFLFAGEGAGDGAAAVPEANEEGGGGDGEWGFLNYTGDEDGDEVDGEGHAGEGNQEADDAANVFADANYARKRDHFKGVIEKTGLQLRAVFVDHQGIDTEKEAEDDNMVESGIPMTRATLHAIGLRRGLKSFMCCEDLLGGLEDSEEDVRQVHEWLQDATERAGWANGVCVMTASIDLDACMRELERMSQAAAADATVMKWALAAALVSTVESLGFIAKTLLSSDDGGGEGGGRRKTAGPSRSAALQQYADKCRASISDADADRRWRYGTVLKGISRESFTDPIDELAHSTMASLLHNQLATKVRTVMQRPVQVQGIPECVFYLLSPTRWDLECECRSLLHKAPRLPSGMYAATGARERGGTGGRIRCKEGVGLVPFRKRQDFVFHEGTMAAVVAGRAGGRHISFAMQLPVHNLYCTELICRPTQWLRILAYMARNISAVIRRTSTKRGFMAFQEGDDEDDEDDDVRGDKHGKRGKESAESGVNDRVMKQEIYPDALRGVQLRTPGEHALLQFCDDSASVRSTYQTCQLDRGGVSQVGGGGVGYAWDREACLEQVLYFMHHCLPKTENQRVMGVYAAARADHDASCHLNPMANDHELSPEGLRPTNWQTMGVRAYQETGLLRQIFTTKADVLMGTLVKSYQMQASIPDQGVPGHAAQFIGGPPSAGKTILLTLRDEMFGNLIPAELLRQYGTDVANAIIPVDIGGGGSAASSDIVCGWTEPRGGTNEGRSCMTNMRGQMIIDADANGKRSNIATGCAGVSHMDAEGFFATRFKKGFDFWGDTRIAVCNKGLDASNGSGPVAVKRTGMGCTVIIFIYNPGFIPIKPGTLHDAAQGYNQTQCAAIASRAMEALTKFQRAWYDGPSLSTYGVSNPLFTMDSLRTICQGHQSSGRYNRMQVHSNATRDHAMKEMVLGVCSGLGLGFLKACSIPTGMETVLSMHSTVADMVNNIVNCERDSRQATWDRFEVTRSFYTRCRSGMMWDMTHMSHNATYVLGKSGCRLHCSHIRRYMVSNMGPGPGDPLQLAAQSMLRRRDDVIAIDLLTGWAKFTIRDEQSAASIMLCGVTTKEDRDKLRAEQGGDETGEAFDPVRMQFALPARYLNWPRTDATTIGEQCTPYVWHEFGAAMGDKMSPIGEEISDAISVVPSRLLVPVTQTRGVQAHMAMLKKYAETAVGGKSDDKAKDTGGKRPKTTLHDEDHLFSVLMCGFREHFGNNPNISRADFVPAVLANQQFHRFAAMSEKYNRQMEPVVLMVEFSLDIGTLGGKYNRLNLHTRPVAHNMRLPSEDVRIVQGDTVNDIIRNILDSGHPDDKALGFVYLMDRETGMPVFSRQKQNPLWELYQGSVSLRRSALVSPGVMGPDEQTARFYWVAFLVAWIETACHPLVKACNPALSTHVLEHCKKIAKRMDADAANFDNRRLTVCRDVCERLHNELVQQDDEHVNCFLANLLASCAESDHATRVNYELSNVSAFFQDVITGGFNEGEDPNGPLSVEGRHALNMLMNYEFMQERGRVARYWCDTDATYRDLKTNMQLLQRRQEEELRRQTLRGDAGDFADDDDALGLMAYSFMEEQARTLDCENWPQKLDEVRGESSVEAARRLIRENQSAYNDTKLALEYRRRRDQPDKEWTATSPLGSFPTCPIRLEHQIGKLRAEQYTMPMNIPDDGFDYRTGCISECEVLRDELFLHSDLRQKNTDAVPLYAGFDVCAAFGSLRGAPVDEGVGAYRNVRTSRPSSLYLDASRAIVACSMVEEVRELHRYNSGKVGRDEQSRKLTMSIARRIGIAQGVHASCVTGIQRSDKVPTNACNMLMACGNALHLTYAANMRVAWMVEDGTHPVGTLSESGFGVLRVGQTLGDIWRSTCYVRDTVLQKRIRHALLSLFPDEMHIEHPEFKVAISPEDAGIRDLNNMPTTTACEKDTLQSHYFSYPCREDRMLKSDPSTQLCPRMFGTWKDLYACTAWRELQAAPL